MDSLDGILRELLARTEGAVVTAIASMDGLVVEQQPKAGFDLAATAAELTNVLTGVNRALGEHMGAGATRELMISTERTLAFVRVVTPELYLVISMDESGNLGKARLHVDEAAQRVVELLA